MNRSLLVAIFSLLSVGSCDPTTEAKPCDPLSQRLLNGSQYISDEVLNDNGRWDYRKWTKYFLRTEKHTPVYRCIPIEASTSLEELIQEQDATVDLRR